MPMTDLASVSVLVIDDQELARRAVTAVLGKIGVTRITITENGAQAIERLKAAETKIDLIICDIDMPEMTGWEFIREIRDGTVDNRKDIPILMLTGLDTDYGMTGEQYRIDGFITKPATADRLRAHIIRVLGASAG